MPKAVNIDGLSRAAITYNNLLRELPYFKLNEIAKNLRLNIISVQGEDVLISKRRKAGVLRPYSPGLTLGNEQELMKFFEAKLKPELTYAEINENITSYKEKKVVSNQGEMLDNKSKKHPLELIILRDMVISYAEDVAFQLFFAERDTAILSPSTAFTGFNPRLDILVAAGEISAAKGNLKTTGTFDLPADETDTDAYLKLVDFLSSAHPLMRKGECLLYAADKPLKAALKAYTNIVRYHQNPTMEDMLNKLRSDVELPNLQVLRDPILGTGDRLLLMQPGNLDLGVNNEGDAGYVQVRNPYKDPNIVQYWIQAAYDTRVNDVHQKLFMMNEQVNTGVNLAGDY
jgi:hypothetical protein